MGQKLLEKHPHLKDTLGYRANDFGTIVAAASLAHDIGNPPFGHSGEKSIGEFFKTGEGKRFKTELTDKQYQDLCDFEGNANGFKILTESRQGTRRWFKTKLCYAWCFYEIPKRIPSKKTNITYCR